MADDPPRQLAGGHHPYALPLDATGAGAANASAWKPVFADRRHEVVELEFTDCYGNKWRRCYGRNKEGQYVQSFVLIAVKEPELSDYVES